MAIPNINKERTQRRKSAVDLGTMVYGKIPPQAKDLEEAVLGAIMLEKDAFDNVVEILNFLEKDHCLKTRALLCQ